VNNVYLRRLRYACIYRPNISCVCMENDNSNILVELGIILFWYYTGFLLAKSMFSLGHVCPCLGVVILCLVICIEALHLITHWT
jgi:hypothetical protein